MKKYKANEDLIEILKKNDFIETSSEIDIKKGKKTFKLSKYAKKTIHFDYINIVIYDGIHGQENRHSINESELKILMLYFKLNATDLKEITKDLPFRYKFAIDVFEYLKEELSDLKRLNLRKPRIGKLERIIELHNQVKL